MKNLFSTLSVLFIAAAAYSAEGKLVLAGSDVLGPVVSKEISALCKAANIDVKIDMRGTYMAHKALESGAADVAIVALPKKAKMPADLLALPFAYQAAVVIVNTVNPIDEISTQQLLNIYSAGAKAHAESWAQIGVSDVSLRSIMAVTTSFSDNIVIELFKSEALGGANLGSWVNMVPKYQDILNIIKTNNSAIAIVGRASGDDMIKVLPVSESVKGKSYAYRPDIESIFNGDYPITLPFYIVCKKASAAKAKDLVKILLDDKIADKLESSQFYAAPKNSRKKSVFELDIVK